MIRPGEEWGSPTGAPAELEVSGGDADLAAGVRDRAGVLVRFHPDGSSDLARAVGLGADFRPGGDEGPRVALGLDLLRVRSGASDTGPQPVAVNMLVVGTAPDSPRRFVRRFGANVRVDGRSVFHGPCTTIVIATGQFLRALDVVPRGHPGDGRAEVQIYAVRSRERRLLRDRLVTGTHVPHPAITQRSGVRVDVSIDRAVAWEADGRLVGKTTGLEVEVDPEAYRLLV